jgi:2-polyprenyl-6-hydroxyphenyl methylase/3-demethylubiquinone-9 3-methyltransferase
MDLRLREALTALPRFDLAADRTGVPCKICGSPTSFFDVTDFNKCAMLEDNYKFGAAGIAVDWHQCQTCWFVFTTFFDDWTPEDFSTFVYNDDYVKIDGEYVATRPERTAVAAARLLRGLESTRILDYGSGAGVFAQQMAAHGFSRVENYDPFSSPARPIGQFDVITCFEVVEHAPDPIGTFTDIAAFLAPGGTVIVGTALQPPDFDAIRANWWYAAPRNGHASLYSDAALAVAASRVGLRFHPGGMHAFTSPVDGPLVALTEERIGLPLFFANLGAPPIGAAEGWHGVETQPRGAYRWTAERRIAWTVDLPRGNWRLQVRVPVWAKATDGECTMTMNDHAVVVRDLGSFYAAESETPLVGEVTIALTTPPTHSPHELKGSPDMRRLGLGVPILDPEGLVPVGRHARRRP